MTTPTPHAPLQECEVMVIKSKRLAVHPGEGAPPSRSISLSIIAAAVVVALLCLAPLSVSAAGSGIPPGYSSEIIQVKFRASADVARPEALMPAKLQGSVRNMRPLFNLPKAKLNNMRGTNLNLWFQITLAPGTDAASFLEELRRAENVEVAEPAPLPQPPPATTPNFTGDQGYLNPATDGIDARFSWTRLGGNASGITLYDVEYSWNQMHEDLSKVNGVALLLNLGDAAVDPFRDTNHGTAVLGELIANNDTRGVTGIAWGATIRLAPANTQVLGYNPANAILLAVADGAAGDVILIEQQTPVCGLQQYGPLEAVTSVFDAIQTAVAHGLVVVEAAGNGAVNLDQAACGNIFNRSARDSGAIIVGAGGLPAAVRIGNAWPFPLMAVAWIYRDGGWRGHQRLWLALRERGRSNQSQFLVH